MSMALNSHVAYGFIMDKNPKPDALPAEYQVFVAVTGLVTVNKGVKIPMYENADFVETLELILFGSYAKLDIAFPIDKDNETIVVYIKDTHQTAKNKAQIIDLNHPPAEAEDQINNLATIFGKKVGWLTYPTKE